MASVVGLIVMLALVGVIPVLVPGLQNLGVLGLGMVEAGVGGEVELGGTKVEGVEVGLCQAEVDAVTIDPGLEVDQADPGLEANPVLELNAVKFIGLIL